jgi:integrase
LTAFYAAPTLKGTARTSYSIYKSGLLTNKPLHQQDAHRIIRRRAKAAGIETRIGNHTFRATGITAYLKNSGKLEVAQQIW